MMTCVIKGCNLARDFQGHHIKPRGAGGSDGSWNRLGVCRVHHQEIEAIGNHAFAEKYPEIKPFLERAEEMENLWQRWKAGSLNTGELTERERGLLSEIQYLVGMWKRPSK